MEDGQGPIASRSGEGHRTVSFRWLARRLDGPGAEPLTKDFKALRISWSEMSGGEGVESGGMGPFHSSMKSPASHLLIRDFISTCVTRHWVGPPLV